MQSTPPSSGGGPARASLFVPTNRDDRSTHSQRQAIGYLGLLLPIALWVVSGWRSTEGVPGWSTLDSISEYYHSGATAVLTGVLAALAVFLFTYRGYENAGQRWDLLAGKVACFAALGVSFFPTSAITPFGAPFWWTEWMRTVHYLSAAVLFGSLIFYSLFLFRRTDPGKGAPAPDKKRRNVVYVVCGLGMAICMVWALLAGRRGGPIFWPETVTLELFAISWLVKGRAQHTLWQLGKRAAATLRPGSPGPEA